MFTEKGDLTLSNVKRLTFNFRIIKQLHSSPRCKELFQGLSVFCFVFMAYNYTLTTLVSYRIQRDF